MNGNPAIIAGLSYVGQTTGNQPSPAGAALASLMIACCEGRLPEFSAHGPPRDRLGRTNATIQWRENSDTERACNLDMDEGRWEIKNPPDDGPQIDDHSSAMSSVDKMLQAISEGWNIRAFQPKANIAVISWDRMSHGNHPAVVMQRHPDTIIFYYEAPDEYGTDDRLYQV